MVGLGDKVKDQISGFTGICTGRAEYLFGCVQVLVAPTVAKDDKPAESMWFDEDRMVVMKVSVIKRPPSAEVRSGGPLMSAPPPKR